MAVTFVGCGGGEGSTNNPGNSGNPGNNGNTTTGGDTTIDTDDYESSVPEGVEEWGTHILTAPKIENKWLVQNGGTTYKLVVPADTTEADKYAFRESRREFLNFFNQATGIVLDVEVDTALPQTTHSPDQHYISFGKTTLLESLEGEKAINYSKEEVGLIGGKIKTVDNNIYICSYTDQGLWNTVYTFLSITFNWECYSANTVVIDENVTDLNLFDYDVFDIPDILYQSTSGYEKNEFPVGGVYGYNHIHPTEGGYYYGHRMRAFNECSISPRHIFEGEPEDVTPEMLSQIQTCSGHNSLKLMQREVYEKIHPAWYDEKGIQLCYSAHGDAEEFELMTTYLANAYILTYMQYPVEKYPHQRMVHLSITDDMNMCTCSTCNNYKSLGYNDSGIIIRFINRVAEKVRAWMQEEGNEKYRRDDFMIETSAYYNVEAAPAEIDPATGEWKAVAEEVILGPNCLIKWAPIDADFQQSLFVEDNKVTKDTFDAWAVVASGNISYFMYNYNCNYHNYFYDAFDFYNTQVMNYILKRGHVKYYSENIHGNVPTEWGALISYVNAKLCYDSTLDSGKLIKNWFNAVFGPAAGVMMDMFNQERVFNHLETMRIDAYGGRSNRIRARENFHWDLEILQGWIGKADAGLRLIEHLKDTNPEEWSRIAYNIELEIFSLVYIIYDQAISLTAEQDQQYVSRIKNNVATWPEYRYVDKVSTFTNK